MRQINKNATKNTWKNLCVCVSVRVLVSAPYDHTHTHTHTHPYESYVNSIECASVCARYIVRSEQKKSSRIIDAHRRCNPKRTNKCCLKKRSSILKCICSAPLPTHFSQKPQTTTQPSTALSLVHISSAEPNDERRSTEPRNILYTQNLTAM